ncbi:hypothetical protein Bca52824_037132 [Brassica carinata]|uniref:MATH domain-containing protein n=1 Tax=Brassica carinata TaxID=52824 RepID=A0A8X7V258_BRACI|nr:hypothetical protein Bca52824_037132 [Brassica carinata]
MSVFHGGEVTFLTSAISLIRGLPEVTAGNKKINAKLQQEDKEMLVPHYDVVDGPAQPMEGMRLRFCTSGTDGWFETVVSTVENQPAEEPPTLKFTWTIPNFSRQNTRKLYSDVSVVGGYKWRILIFPKVMLIHTVDEIVSLYEDLTARNLADDQENTVDEIVSLTSLLKSFTH